jgi:response regulator RpfG family c-di-GMP phosphodiesterase
MAAREKELNDTRLRARLREHVVLCVDDDLETLNALRRLMRDEPYRFLATDRPYEALAWVDANKVSLVISDHRMPEMMGTRLLQEVYKRSPATARFLLTAYQESQEVLEALGRTVQGVIAKPWDGQALKRTILAILRWQDERERAPAGG